MYKVKEDITNHISSSRDIRNEDIKEVGEYELTEFRRILGATESQFEIVFKEKIVCSEDGLLTDIISLPKSIFDACFQKIG
ncbi:hypothetical protein ACSW8S_17415 (plasmid) [Clostridium perfringens]